MVRVFAGVVSDADHQELSIREGHGMCLNPTTFRSVPEGMPLMIDTGGFPAALAGIDWDCEPWAKLVRQRIPEAIRKRRIPRPSIAIVPDIPVLTDDPEAGQRSLLFSLKWLRVWGIPHGYPWFLAVQPGVMPKDVGDLVHEFQGIAIGGTIRYKNASIRPWAEFCAENRLKLHVLRYGTEERLETAGLLEEEFGIEISVDSSNFTQNDTFGAIEAARRRVRVQGQLPKGEVVG